MNILEDIRYVGLFQTAQNMTEASSDADDTDKLEAAMPMPGASIAPRTEAAVDYILQNNKQKLLLLSPEIAILSALAERNVKGLRIFIAVPADIPEESLERIRNNIPKSLDVRFVENLYIPGGFFPENGMVISFGYTAKGYLMVLPETYHMNKVYSSFPGQKLFVPYVELEDYLQPDTWMRIRPDTFDDIWRYAQ